MKIAIINGPNLNLLGERETEIYGNEGFDGYLEKLKEEFLGITFYYYQSNVEGEIVTAVQKFGFYGGADAIVINPGGYSHTSVAIADSVKASKVPVILVHLSNIFARETFRNTDLVAGHCKGAIIGLGLQGYKWAITDILSALDHHLVI